MIQLRGRTALFCFIFSLCNISLSSAQTITISGYVNDSRSGEALIGTNVYEVNLQYGTTTNNYGFFSITLPGSSTILRFSYQGFATQTIDFQESNDQLLLIELDPIVLELDSLEVFANDDRIEEQVQMSRVNLSILDVQTLPSLLGEPDILKTLQLMPGIQSGAEGSSGLYVRGGTPDQVLILMDGAHVYNVGHLFGFLSTFNTDALNSASLLKGGFPARYGGRLASVLDLTMREGNRKKFTGVASIGLLASQATIEGPIQKEKSSYIFSARRTYLDLLNLGYQRILGDDFTQGYFFHDINAKVNFDLSPKDRLFVSTYIGQDKGYEDDGGFDGYRYEIGWQNITSTLRWNRVVSSRMFMNILVLFSEFQVNALDRTNRPDAEIIIDSETGNIITDENSGITIRSSRYSSGIRDIGIKTDFEYQAHPNHYVRFGGGFLRHRFKPSEQSHRELNEDMNFDTKTSERAITVAYEWSSYVEDEFSIQDLFKVNGGVHLSAYHVEGTFYSSVQPRLSVLHILPNDWAFKASYAHMQQYIQQLTNGGLGVPTDLWLPSTPQIRPQKAWQVAVGVARTLRDEYDVTIEAYYKNIDRLVAYKEGSNYVGSSVDWEERVTSGRGWAYGSEFLIQRKRGAITGWIGYTLSWSNRRIPALNGGESFPHQYDRRHDVSIAFMYRWGNRKISANWVYTTGRAVTINTSQFRDRGVLIDVYSERNNYRIPAYHRLDLAYHFPPSKKIKSELTISLYNAYYRQNVLYLTTKDSTELHPHTGFYNESRTFRKTTLFPVLPSVSYRLYF